MRRFSLFAVVGGLLFALACPAPAAVFDLDFETDPADMGVEFYGTAEWRDFDGFDDTGYLSVTDAANDQRGAIIFPDLENGQSLTAFHITADLRVGGGTDPPADGFSFNFARPDDPVLDDGEGWAASPTNEANLPEEGTTTGLGIGFDEWLSGAPDVIGMSIRVDNQLISQYEFPVVNGDVDDTESLQTGPAQVFDDELQDMLGWAPLDMKLCANNLTVQYKGVEVFNQTVDFDPTPGLLVFGGRTGGSNAYHHIDNVSIKTGDDVGAGCSVIPPSYVAGEGTIGTRTFDGERSNEVYGEPEDTSPGLLQEWSQGIANPGNRDAVLDIIENEPLVAPPFKSSDGTSWWTGSQTPGWDVPQYPSDLSGLLDSETDNSNYVTRLTGEIFIPESGTYVFADGIDDYTYWALDADKSGEAGDDVDEIIIDDNNWDNLQRDQNRADGLGEIDIDVAEGGEWVAVEFLMGEGGGGDAGVIYWDYDTEGGGLNAADGFPEFPDEVIDLVDAEFWLVPDTHLRAAGAAPLLSADLIAANTITRPIEFDVNGDTNEADQLAMDNPDSDVFTTILDIDGAIFQIAATGALANGDTFDLIDADTIVGSPTVQSLDPSQTWGFNPATGEITLGGAVFVPLQAGDADQDLDFDQLDLVLVQVAAKYLTGQAATWGEGDWNGAPGGSPGNPPEGDGVFSQVDIIAALTAGKYLTGKYGALAPEGTGDNKATITYDPANGEVGVVAGATELTSINIDSAASIFTGDAADNLGGSFDNDADNNIFKATFGSSFGSLSFGNVAQAGLSEEFVRDDLTAVGSLLGGGDLGMVDLVYVPEPSSICLLVFGIAGACVMRRRRK